MVPFSYFKRDRCAMGKIMFSRKAMGFSSKLTVNLTITVFDSKFSIATVSSNPSRTAANKKGQMRTWTILDSERLGKGLREETGENREI